MVDRNIGEYNRVTASTDSYVRTNFNIKPTDEETCNVISSTFGVIKNNILQAVWCGPGWDDYVIGALTT